MVSGSLGQQVGMETALSDALPCASVSPQVKQGCGVQYNPRKGGEGLELEPVFLKPVQQPSRCKAPLAEEGDKVTQGASRRWRGAGSELGSISAKPTPKRGCSPRSRTSEHPLARTQEPFRKPSAPPSVPTFFLGFVPAHPRHVVWHLVPRMGTAAPAELGEMLVCSTLGLDFYC